MFSDNYSYIYAVTTLSSIFNMPPAKGYVAEHHTFGIT
jgi:hypothetical protein